MGCTAQVRPHHNCQSFARLTKWFNSILVSVCVANDEYIAQMKVHKQRLSDLQKHRGQTFSMIRGQCMQSIVDKMKHDPDYERVMESGDPRSSF